MAAVETISRDEFDRQVNRGDVTVFHYKPNSRGFIFLQVCAALLFVISFVVYLSTSFDPRYWAVLSIFLSSVGLGLLYLVVRWSRFARDSAIAFDKQFLYVVTSKQVECIHWEDVSAESAGFSDPADDGDHGTLNMHIDGKEVAVRLFNPFVWVDDFPTFLVELLSQIKHNRELEQSGEDEGSSEDERTEPGPTDNSSPPLEDTAEQTDADESAESTGDNHDEQAPDSDVHAEEEQA